ncbi:TlpA family protein disulfide reductase [Sphingobacterium corticis]|uniref:TlpA family protein disulfide reductase n=1 Tax=Sphingobacterium corticis TaxID=1812823 RepID=A0ABW5NIS6_9SPHI
MNYIFVKFIAITFLIGFFYFSDVYAQNPDNIHQDYTSFSLKDSVRIFRGKILGLDSTELAKIPYADVRVQTFDVEGDSRISCPISVSGTFDVILPYHIPLQELFLELGDYSETFFVLDSIEVDFDFQHGDEPEVHFRGENATSSEFLFSHNKALKESEGYKQFSYVADSLIDAQIDSAVFFRALNTWSENTTSLTNKFLHSRNVSPALRDIVLQSNEAQFLSYVLHYYSNMERMLPEELSHRIKAFQTTYLLSSMSMFYHYLYYFARSVWEEERQSPALDFILDTMSKSVNMNAGDVDLLMRTKTLFIQYQQDKSTELKPAYFDELESNFQIVNDRYNATLQRTINEWVDTNRQTLWDFFSDRYPQPIDDILIAKSGPRKEQLTIDSLSKTYERILTYIETPKISYFIDAYVKSIQKPLVAADEENYNVVNKSDSVLVPIDFAKDAELYVVDHFGGGELFDHLLTKYKGKVLFVDFWATWCVPCYEDFERAKMLKNGLDTSNIVFLYLCCDSEQGEWIGRIRERELSGVHVLFNKEQRRELFNRFNLDGYPSYLFVDKSGHIEHHARWVLNDPKKGQAFLLEQVDK